MFRFKTLSLLCAALLLCAPVTWAQYTRDNAANKKIDEAINQHYFATDFTRAEAILLGTVNACGDKCSPEVLARAWMYVGIVRGGGKNDLAGAQDAFQKALAIDANVKLDAALATPETQNAFDQAAAGGGASSATGGGRAETSRGGSRSGGGGELSCTPGSGEVQTRRPIPISCSSNTVDIQTLTLKYKAFGGDSWKSLKMRKKGDEFRAQIPCDATQSGELRFYVVGKDDNGDQLGFGTKSEPHKFQLLEETDAEPPAFDGEPPPKRCAAKSECPPDFPGCGDSDNKPKHGDVDWGGSCQNSLDCKEGLQCQDGVCEAAPSCASDSDCDSGSCTNGKCQVGESGASGPEDKKNWFGLHIAQDVALVGGETVCSRNSQLNNGFACYEGGSSTKPFVGSVFSARDKISSGLSPATLRILLSYDRAFNSNLLLGGRIGYALGGGPPAGMRVDPTTGRKLSDGNPFLPFHLEARATYLFGNEPLAKKGMKLYAHFGGGIAQVDSKATMELRDCRASPNPDECRKPNADPLLAPQNRRTYDIWKKMGQGFITVGGGAIWAFNPKMGAQLNLNIMYLLPTTGFNLEPSLGVLIGL